MQRQNHVESAETELKYQQFLLGKAQARIFTLAQVDAVRKKYHNGTKRWKQFLKQQDAYIKEVELITARIKDYQNQKQNQKQKQIANLQAAQNLPYDYDFTYDNTIGQWQNAYIDEYFQQTNY